MKYILTFIWVIFTSGVVYATCTFVSSPIFAESLAIEQLQGAAKKGNAAIETTSADKSKGAAADAFHNNGTDACLCKASNGVSFACSCDNPLAINGKDKDYSKGYTAKEVGLDANSIDSTKIKPTDLIKESSTASEIHPEEWQERNPQHKQDIKIIPADPVDAILAGQTENKEEKQGKYESQEAVDANGQPILSGGESDVVLLNQAASNARSERIAKEEAERAEQAAKDAGPDFDDVLVGAVAGAAVTHAVMGSPSSHKKKIIKSGSKATGCKAKCRAVGAGWNGEYLDNGGCLCVM